MIISCRQTPKSRLPHLGRTTAIALALGLGIAPGLRATVVFDGATSPDAFNANIDAQDGIMAGGFSVGIAQQPTPGAPPPPTDGSLVISSGSTLTAGGDVLVGNTAGNDGTMIVTGTGSGLLVPGQLVVGNGVVLPGLGGGVPGATSVGTVDVSAGASLEAAQLVVGTFAAGATSGLGDGALDVSGTGSHLQINGFARIGQDGTGTLDLTSGATAAVSGDLSIAHTGGGSGSVTVGNGAALDVERALRVGEAGTGTLDLEGGAITAGALVAGRAPSGNGDIAITGSTSRVDLMGVPGVLPAQLQLGVAGRADMRIDLGAEVVLHGDGAIVQVARGDADQPGAPAARPGSGLEISGGGRLVADGAGVRMNIGQTANASGTVTLSGGGSALRLGAPDSRLRVGRDGAGLLSVSFGASVQAGLIEVGSQGVLMGNGGTVAGVVTVAAGGVVSPGLSPGELHFSDFVDFAAGGTLVLEVGVASGGGLVLDRVHFDGGVDLAGAIVELSLLDGLGANVLDTLSIGDFVDVLGVAAAPSVFADASFTLRTGGPTTTALAFSTSTGGFALPPSAVPEPASLALALLGLVGARRRRRG